MAAAAIVEVEDDDVLPSPIIVFAMPLVVNCCCLRSADDDVCRARAENMINLVIFAVNDI